jgi:hypothetical protein
MPYNVQAKPYTEQAKPYMEQFSNPGYKFSGISSTSTSDSLATSRSTENTPRVATVTKKSPFSYEDKINNTDVKVSVDKFVPTTLENTANSEKAGSQNNGKKYQLGFLTYMSKKMKDNIHTNTDGIAEIASPENKKNVKKADETKSILLSTREKKTNDTKAINDETKKSDVVNEQADPNWAMPAYLQHWTIC